MRLIRTVANRWVLFPLTKPLHICQIFCFVDVDWSSAKGAQCPLRSHSWHNTLCVEHVLAWGNIKHLANIIHVFKTNTAFCVQTAHIDFCRVIRAWLVVVRTNCHLLRRLASVALFRVGVLLTNLVRSLLHIITLPTTLAAYTAATINSV